MGDLININKANTQLVCQHLDRIQSYIKVIARANKSLQGIENIPNEVIEMINFFTKELISKPHAELKEFYEKSQGEVVNGIPIKRDF